MNKNGTACNKDSSLEINDCINLSNKICYKCAYELEQCAKFMQKYKKSYEKFESKDKISTSCCFLCCEIVDNDRIFDITKDNNNAIFNPLRKIRSIFNNDIDNKNNGLKLICLSCRYNLDVLYDLKRIYKETITNLKALINGEINYSNFPKVHTDVVNRRTTITTFSNITFYGSVNSSDSDSNEKVMGRKKRAVKRRKSRSNIKLQNKSKIRSCDKCYDTVANGADMYRFYHTGLTVCKKCWLTIDPNDKIRRSRQTRSDLAEIKLCTVFLTDVLNQESYKQKKMDKMEKDDDNNTSCDSSQGETKSSESSPLSVSSRTRSHINGKARQGIKRQINMEQSKDDNEHILSKMTKLNKEMELTKESVDVDQQLNNSTKTRGRKRILIDKSSDTDGSWDKNETNKNKLTNRNNLSKKRQKLITKEEAGSDVHLESSDETSNEEAINLKNKIKGLSLSTTFVKKDGKEKNIRSRTKSSSSTEILSTTEIVSLQSEIKTEYACDKCNKKFDTKLSIEKHKLSHLKQAALKLEKLNVSNVKNKEEMEVNLQDDRISEDTVPSNPDKITSDDKHIDDLSEDIAINIEDDTDDEEILSVSDKKNKKKKLEKETNNKDDNIIDKMDTTDSESHVKENSLHDGNIETKEIREGNIEQYEKSTVVSDETTLGIQDDKNKKGEHTTINKDNSLANRHREIIENGSKDKNEQETVIAITIENCNTDEEEDKNEEIHNDAEISFTKKDQINECNTDDEGDSQEKTPCCNETSKSPICDIDKKDAKESEEEIQKFTSIDKTDILNDEKDLKHIKREVEISEQSENKSHEKNMEVEMIADVDESDKIKENLDLSNSEKHDEMEINNKDDVTLRNSNDNNGKTEYKNIEDTISKDSIEKSKLEQEIQELEELVDEDTMGYDEKKINEVSTALNNSSEDAANEILQEVFELAAAEVQQREDNSNAKILGEVEMETVENISREIRKSADMPSLDPISLTEINDKDITFN